MSPRRTASIRQGLRGAGSSVREKEATRRHPYDVPRWLCMMGERVEQCTCSVSVGGSTGADASSSAIVAEWV
jgi:hypothetical protein